MMQVQRVRLMALLVAALFLAAPLMAQASNSCLGCCCSTMSEAGDAGDCATSITAGDCCEIAVATGRLPADRVVSSFKTCGRPPISLHSLPELVEATVRTVAWPAARLAHRVSPLRRSVVLLI